MVVLISFFSLCLAITAFLMVSSARHNKRVLEIRENMARHLCSANQTAFLTAENGDVLFIDSSGGVKKYTKGDSCNMPRKERVSINDEDMEREIFMQKFLKKQVNKKLRLNGYLVTKIEHIPAIAGERRMFFISCEGTRGTFLYEDELLEQLKSRESHVHYNAFGEKSETTLEYSGHEVSKKKEVLTWDGEPVAFFHEDIYNEMINGEFRHIFADMGKEK